MGNQEILFEVKFQIQKRMLREFYWKTTPPSLALIFLALAAFFGSTTIRLLRSGALLLNPFIPLISIYVLAWPFWRVHNAVKKQYQQIQRSNGGSVPQTHIVFTDEDITLARGQSSSVFQYDEIVRTICLKSSYVLMLDQKRGILLDKQELSGSGRDFTHFLRQHCPEISIANFK